MCKKFWITKAGVCDGTDHVPVLNVLGVPGTLYLYLYRPWYTRINYESVSKQ